MTQRPGSKALARAAEILELVAQGMQRKAIAHRLGISEVTLYRVLATDRARRRTDRARYTERKSTDPASNQLI